jgi:hypothetical protein
MHQVRLNVFNLICMEHDFVKKNEFVFNNIKIYCQGISEGEFVVIFVFFRNKMLSLIS